MRRLGITFLVTAFILFFLLVLSALIPQEAIQSRMEESADFLIKREEHFYNIIDGIDCTKIDQYADSILLNIAYNLDSDHPLESILWSRYYFKGANTRNADFHDTVHNRSMPNRQYLRYWHGAIVIVRLFHLFGNIQHMYIWHSIFVATLLIWLELLLIKRKMIPEAVCLLISLIAINAWVIPLCLEYTWMFILMLISSICLVYFFDSVYTGL